MSPHASKVELYDYNTLALSYSLIYIPLDIARLIFNILRNANDRPCTQGTKGLIMHTCRLLSIKIIKYLGIVAIATPCKAVKVIGILSHSYTAE